MASTDSRTGDRPLALTQVNVLAHVPVLSSFGALGRMRHKQPRPLRQTDTFSLTGIGSNVVRALALVTILVQIDNRVAAQLPKIAPEWKAHYKVTPVIENCVFERKTFSGHNETNLYQFRYQQDAFVMRQIKSLLDVPSNHIATATVYAGRFRSNYWAIGAGGVLELFPNADKLMKERKNPDAALVWSAESMIYSALYYGINGLDPTTVEWSAQTTFTASSISGVRYIGEVMETANGLPTLLEWHFEKYPNIHFLLEYKYDVNLGLPYYPSEIQLFMEDGQKKVLGGAYRILILKTSPTPLREERFDSASYFEKSPSSRISTVLVTNNDIYAVGRGGKLGKVLPLSMVPPDNHRTVEGRSSIVGLFVLGFSALSLVPLFLLWERNKHQNKRNNQ
jgi:hypothetical protein